MPEQRKKQGREEREGKRKGTSQNRVWAGRTTEEEKSPREILCSIAAVSKVIESDMLKT